ncbi:ankyrin [Aspergillus eucalypticola CBS 122712]|uniref:Ankyrin n=1 Tax=Aspergillus eucalypticola (strain CBS 122712 / IBT 29274) TaxID=1448314 RepID=A0A317W7A5_ASPEC|nr:ankyrin [Aspergillus eucalypticola CBS 122712]PWY82524.1 ankyrin [Aspergillus eucalypticola CBS 122712]
MTTALTKAARLKPEVRLGQAISEFQADCSSREKATLRSYQAAGIPPSVRDVMQLTAEINRSAGLRGQCFGSRLTSILQAVQEFAALGDIVLGASQSLLACGIWAVVRMSLLSIVKYSTYFEQLSSMLMAVGRSAPRYQLMGAVYPTSRRLRTSMLEYFIVVVQLCHHAMKLSRKTAIGQWVSTFTSALKGYQSDLEIWATAIKEEVNLQMVQQLSLVAEDNSWFRSRVARRFESQSHARRLRARQRVLDACSTYDYEQDWKRIRKLGATTLLETSMIYKQWKAPRGSEGLQSRTLICTGMLGSGKSVILANMVDDLNLDSERKAVVAYFFCQHDSTQSLTPKTVIGSLARQLLQSESDLDAARDVLGDKQSLEVDGIITLLRHLLPPHFEALFVLDGLMHCDRKVRQVILESLQEIQKLIKLALCVSVRPEPADSLQELKQLQNQRCWSVTANKFDIDAFINAELERCLESGKLIINDPALVLDVRDSLSQGADGMFLWVALQIEALCLERTDADIRKAIANLPKDLSALYTMILERSSLSGTTYQSKILDLVATACRPLTTEEMKEALSVIPWKTFWDPARILNDIHSTLACCGGLLTVDEENWSIRMVHHSVRTFLNDHRKNHRDLMPANQTMAETIATYLSYENFYKQFSISVTTAVIHSALLRLKRTKDTDVGYNLLQRLQASRAMVWWQEHIWYLDPNTPNLNKLLMTILDAHGYDKPDSSGQTPFLALVDWLLARGARHTDDLFGQSPLSWAIHGGYIAVIESLLKSEVVMPNAVGPSGKTHLTSAIIRKDIELTKCFLACDRSDGYTPLMEATRHNFVEAIPLFLSGPHTDILAVTPSGDSALHLAASLKGPPIIFNLLLEHARLEEKGSQAASMANRKGETPLWLAAANGHLEVVQSICQHQDYDLDVPDARYTDIVKYLGSSGRVNINHLNKAGLSALWEAVLNGHEDAIQAMITMDDLDPNHSGVGAGTPLEAAIHLGNDRIVRLLVAIARTDRAVEEGYDEIVAILVSTGRVLLNRRDHQGVTPLWAAADCGNTNTEGVDLNFPGSHGRTALWVAASKGHAEVVQILVSANQVNLNSKGHNGTTPLWAAVNNRHTEVCPDYTGYTPLLKAAANALVATGRVTVTAEHGHDAVVKILIDSGAAANNTEIASYSRGTPLWIASYNGHAGVVKVLVACPGIELNRRDILGHTPLGIAAKRGHASVVAILAGTPGVELCQLDNNGQSALEIARQYGHEDVINVLEANRPFLYGQSARLPVDHHD